MSKPRWYVTCYADTDPGYPRPKRRDRAWTVSRRPGEEGWITDCGYDGYGLTFAQASELALAANLTWLRRKEPK
jgi:hypothetical protein